MRVLALFALLKIMVTYISFNEGNHQFFVTALMHPVICFQRNKRCAETMDAHLLPVDATRRGEGKKEPGHSKAREERTRAEARERTSEREVVFALFFMEAKSLSRFHVVISISNYPIPKRLHPFGEPAFPSKRRARTWTIILFMLYSNIVTYRSATSP